MGATARVATEQDLSAVESLDAICFPPGREDLEPADPNELRRGIANGRILVIEQDGLIAAYLHYELPTRNHAYLSAVAVHPDHRQNGLARDLMQDFMHRVRQSAEMDATSSISTVTSPRNLPMLQFLLANGFIVRTLMDDYFGSGHPRVYCQFKTRVEFVDPDERFIVPADATETVDRFLRDERYVVTSLVPLPKGPAFEFSRFEVDDFGALESDETQAGVSFAGVVLGAITFLLGFSFASDNYPDAARTLLTGAAFATTVSLIIYANTSGESARFRSNSFSHYMKWGNVLSEYGGVLPFLIALPVTFAGVARSRLAVLLLAVILSAGLWIYEASRFSLSSRFARSVPTRVCAALICSSPLTGALADRNDPALWIWTSVTTAALTGLAMIYLLRRPEEQVTVPRPLGWEPRH